MSRRACHPCRYGEHENCVGDVYDVETERLQWCGCEPTHDYEAPEVFPDDWDTAGAETRYERMMGDR